MNKHATRSGMIPCVLLIVSPILSNDGVWQGWNAVDRETMMVDLQDRQTGFEYYTMHIAIQIKRRCCHIRVVSYVFFKQPLHNGHTSRASNAQRLHAMGIRVEHRMPNACSMPGRLPIAAERTAMNRCSSTQTGMSPKLGAHM